MKKILNRQILAKQMVLGAFLSVFALGCASGKSTPSEQTSAPEMAAPEPAATAEFEFSKMKQAKGEVLFFNEDNGGTRAKIQVSGLAPKSKHGFHIHEKGACTGPDYKSAGGHFNPEGHMHGGPSSTIKHMGDLGNIATNDNGTYEATFELADVKDPKMIIGKALIIHEKADDFSTQPTGAAGARIGCAVIR